MVDVSQGGFGSLAAQEAESTAPWAQMQTPNTFQGKDGAGNVPSAESTLEIDNPSNAEDVLDTGDTGSKSVPGVVTDYDFFSFVDEDDDDLRKKIKSSTTPLEDSGKFKVGIKVDDAWDELDSMLADDKVTGQQYADIAKKLEKFSDVDEVPDNAWERWKKAINKVEEKAANEKTEAAATEPVEQNEPTAPTAGDTLLRDMLGSDYDKVNERFTGKLADTFFPSDKAAEAANKLTEMTGADYTNLSEDQPFFMIDRADFDIGDDKQHLEYLDNLQRVVFDTIRTNINKANDTSLPRDERERAGNVVFELNNVYESILQAKKENPATKESDAALDKTRKELAANRTLIEKKAKQLGLDYANMSEEDIQKLERANAFMNEFLTNKKEMGNPETDEGRKWLASWQKTIDDTPYLGDLLESVGVSRYVEPASMSFNLDEDAKIKSKLESESKAADDEAAFRASIPLSEFARRDPNDVWDIVDTYRQKYNESNSAEEKPTETDSEDKNGVLDFLNKLLKNRVNLQELLDSIKDLSDDELLAQGYTPDAIRVMRDAAAAGNGKDQLPEEDVSTIYNPNASGAAGGMNVQSIGKNEDFNAGQEKQETEAENDVTSDENMKNIRTLYRNQPHIRRMWKNLKNDSKSSKK